MVDIMIVFLFGMLGTFIRVQATRKSINMLMVANVSGVVIASILVAYDFNLIITGFCGSLTTISTLIVIGHENKRYLFMTILISFILSTSILYLYA
jgi:fluoride ion exporter CrcB/FEX